MDWLKSKSTRNSLELSVLAIDTTGSMAQTDFSPSRLGAAQRSLVRGGPPLNLSRTPRDRRPGRLSAASGRAPWPKV